MPAAWQWPDAFIDRLNADIKIVSSSLVCLPEIDAGGYGPKVTTLRIFPTAVAKSIKLLDWHFGRISLGSEVILSDYACFVGDAG